MVVGVGVGAMGLTVQHSLDASACMVRSEDTCLHRATIFKTSRAMHTQWLNLMGEQRAAESLKWKIAIS